MPPKISSLIGKLGLRYEPSVKADLAAHAARVALLAEDMASVDPNALAAALDRWVAAKPYLPKASDLNELMASAAPRSRGNYSDVVGTRNAYLEANGSNLRWQWNDPKDWGAGTHLIDLSRPVSRFASW